MRRLGRQVIYWAILSYFLASFVTAYSSIGWWRELVIMLGVIGVFSLVGSYLFRHRRSGVIVMLVGACCLCFALGLVRSVPAMQHIESVPDTYVEKPVEVTGVVVTDRDVRQNNQKLTLEINQLHVDDTTHNVATRVLVTTERYPLFSYGDEIQLAGKLAHPENFTSDSGREFDYVNYLAKDNIYYQMHYPDIELVSQHHGSFIKRSMLNIKHALNDSIVRSLPQPAAGLLSGELLGEKSALGGTLQEDFRRTGVIHLVVLSGFNVTIVALFFIWILSRVFHPRVALCVGIGSIALFAMLVGGGATVVRASIMAVLVIIARLFGREYDILRGLFIAGFVMALINPQIVVYDISFQLSFLATLSLIITAPYLEQKLSWVTNTFTIRETIIATLSAQALVLPLLLYAVGELSIVSIIVNVLVVPLVPMTMLFGFITALVGLVIPPLAVIPAAPTYILLKLQLFFVETFSQLPFASVAVPKIPTALVVILYGLVFVWVITRSSQQDSPTLAKYTSASSMEDKL